MVMPAPSESPTPPDPSPESSTDHPQLLRAARDVLQQAASAISKLGEQLNSSFLAAAELLRGCRGMVVVTGMGKAGLVGAKVSATLASTGTRSIFVHPAEAAHGDLGRVDEQDVVLVLSFSGTTDEVVRLLEPIRRIGAKLVAVTGHPESPLGRHADLVLDVGKVVEACPLGLAPTTSTSLMLALGDALALTVMRMKSFSSEDFARYHPAGELGRKLLTVGEVMRRGRNAPTVVSGTRLLDAVRAMTDTRAGAVTVVDASGKAIGFYTDGDLRRNLLQRGSNGPFDLTRPPIDEVMTRNPITIDPGHLATEALNLMKKRQLDQILVVSADGRPAGLLDVQDLLLVGLV